MTIYKAYNSVLKVESGGSYVTVAYLTDASIDRSMSDETVTPLFARSVQHTPDESSVMSATLSASGYFSDDANLDLMVDGFSAGDEIGIRLYVDSTTYYEATARITSLSIGGGESGALSVSLSMTLVDVLLIRPYTQLGSRLTASDAAATDYFGESVALSRDGLVLAVGAQQWEGGSSNQGGVYVYDWNGTGWTARGSVLTASDAAASDFFGFSVSLSEDGDVLAVGATGWEGANSGQGGVYIYDRNGTNWTQRGSVLTASDASASNEFGSGVALSADGTILFVGSKGRSTSRGAVYVFDWTGSAWSQRSQIITASDAANSDQFGYRLSCNESGTLLCVGAPFWEGGNTNQGSIYLYEWRQASLTWQETVTAQTASDAATNAYFGIATAIDSDGLNIMIGSNGKSTNAGSVYHFTRSGSTLTQRNTITPTDAASNNYFGTSVAVDRNTGLLIIGAREHNSAATDAGAVYTFYG